MQLFFGFVGAINIVALLPLVLIMHFTGYEPFEFPSTGKAWGAVLVNVCSRVLPANHIDRLNDFFQMFITLCSDYLYVIAMLKTTPVVVTVGLSLTIPLAIVGDEILNIHTKAQAAFGALLVLVSFSLVGWENADKVAQNDGQAENDL
jgi:solute carrier family 35, member F5